MNEHRTPERDEARSTQAASASRSDADMRHLDGNAAAGLLRELFAMDVTGADATEASVPSARSWSMVTPWASSSAARTARRRCSA